MYGLVIVLYGVANGKPVLDLTPIGLFPSQAACEKALPEYHQYFRGKYSNDPKWSVFNAWCLEIIPIDAKTD